MPHRDSRSDVPTIRDVARLAGVSVATVSRVLNRDPGVGEDRRRRVTAAVARLGYRRDGVARNLRRRSTMVWGLVISDIENPFFTSLVRGVQDTANREGYSVVLLNSDEDVHTEAACLHVLAEERVAGVILSPVSERSSNLALLPAATPVVLIDRQIAGAGVDMVRVDNVQGAYQGARHLLDGGRRRIGCITGPPYSTTGAARLRGYLMALEEAGLAPGADDVITTDFKREGGYRAALRMLGRPARPDGLIVMNNLMMEGALHALRELDVRIPDDLALVGFDDLSWARLVTPPLTAVAQPARELGVLAADLLARRCRGDREGFPALVDLRPRLTVRESSRPRT